MQYAKPKTVAEAARLLKEEAGVTRILAGGIDLLVQMKAGMGHQTVTLPFPERREMLTVTV